MIATLPALVLLYLGAAASPTTPPATAPDRHALTVQAIAMGEAAGESGDSHALAAAERLLAMTGARPLANSPDLAALWRAQSQSAGEKPRPPMRGRVLGSAYRQALLGGRDSLRIEQTFLAGRKAQVSLVPGRNAELAVAVADLNGKTLCLRAAAASKPASCSWMPVWTARYRIEVRNPRPTPASAYLVID